MQGIAAARVVFIGVREIGLVEWPELELDGVERLVPVFQFFIILAGKKALSACLELGNERLDEAIYILDPRFEFDQADKAQLARRVGIQVTHVDHDVVAGDAVAGEITVHAANGERVGAARCHAQHGAACGLRRAEVLLGDAAGDDDALAVIVVPLDVAVQSLAGQVAHRGIVAGAEQIVEFALSLLEFHASLSPTVIHHGHTLDLGHAADVLGHKTRDCASPLVVIVVKDGALEAVDALVILNAVVVTSQEGNLGEKQVACGKGHDEARQVQYGG